jgi:hypothetical protein
VTPRWPVEVLPYVGTTEDDYGNETPSWGEPQRRRVFAYAPAGGTEVNGWRHTVTADLTLYAPPDFAVTSRDRVVVAGKTYDVEGEVEDYTHGIGLFTPGVVVNLTRSDS